MRLNDHSFLCHADADVDSLQSGRDSAAAVHYGSGVFFECLGDSILLQAVQCRTLQLGGDGVKPHLSLHQRENRAKQLSIGIGGQCRRERGISQRQCSHTRCHGTYHLQKWKKRKKITFFST